MKNDRIEEFWSLICSGDEQMQEEGQCKRAQFFHENKDYFKKTIEKLPENFAQVYKKVNFHDFQILDIYFNERQKEGAIISIVVYDFHNDYGKDIIFKIIYEGVEKHSISINKTHRRLNWAYDIFECCKNSLWVHRIMCSDANNIVISFKNISIEQQGGVLNESLIQKCL